MSDFLNEAQASLRNAAQTSNQVNGMSDLARVELARNLAGASPSNGSYRRGEQSGFAGSPIRHGSVPKQGEASVARLAADLHKTERRLTSSTASAPVGRHARLSSRAGRLRRKLRRSK